MNKWKEWHCLKVGDMERKTTMKITNGKKGIHGKLPKERKAMAECCLQIECIGGKLPKRTEGHGKTLH